VSPEGRDLIRQLLVVNPMERITIPQIRDHPWFRTSLPRYLEYRESLFIAAEFIDEDVLEEAAEVTGASVETIRESIARAAVAAPDRNAVVYNVLLDRNRQASIAAGGAPDDAVSGSTITHVTSSQRELNQGRILSCSPGIVVLLDQNEASVNKRAYNYAADFLPASLAQHLSPAHQASGAARAVSASPSSFTFSRLANASAGASSFSERVGSFQQRTMSGLSPGLRPMATPPGHVPAAGGGSSVARAYPGGLPPPATRAGSIIGSVAPMQAVYAPEEAEFTAQNFTGWRVGLMTDESSGQAIRELCTVLASLGCEWKTLSPFWLGVRRKHDPRRAAAAAAAAAAAEQARLAAASSTPVGSPAKAAKALGDLSGSQNIAADSAAATSQQVAAAPTVIDACVLGIQLMRLQEQHNKGYVFDFQLFEGSTFEAIELATQIWSRLQCRVG
jgi:5'-AMP-activated protein kinase catalytic alpha subunit